MIRRLGEWYEIPTDHYLDHRYRNWALAEEYGDVVFVPERGVVLVHRVRAEHIVRALGLYTDKHGPGPLIPVPPRLPRAPAPAPPLVVETKATNRWRDLCGWLGILAGVAVFVAALAVPLDDPALLLASAIVVRGRRLILDIDS